MIECTVCIVVLAVMIAIGAYRIHEVYAHPTRICRIEDLDTRATGELNDNDQIFVSHYEKGKYISISLSLGKLKEYIIKNNNWKEIQNG